VDGVTLLEDGSDLRVGSLVEARIVDADDYDLTATPLRVVRDALPGIASASSSTSRRALPVLPIGLEGAWGR
jgi:hypothetical protein